MENLAKKSPNLTIKKKTVYKLTYEEQGKVYGGGGKTGGYTTYVRTAREE